MVKWLGRLLLLLVAFTVVSGITFGVVQSGNGANEQAGIVQPARPSGTGIAGIRGGREGLNWYGIDQLLRPLVVIAATVVVVAPIVEAAKQKAKDRRNASTR